MGANEIPNSFPSDKESNKRDLNDMKQRQTFSNYRIFLSLIFRKVFPKHFQRAPPLGTNILSMATCQSKF